jgi:hypothetical protein
MPPFVAIHHSFRLYRKHSTGIGLPGVAASGTIAANTLVSVKAQMNLMNELRIKGALQ